MSPTSRTVVSADWLRANLGEVTVADVRWYLDGRSGRAAYEEGHIPGAVFIDLDEDLSGPPTKQGGRHPLPEPERFAEAMGRAGIGGRRLVVSYDDCGGMVAGRLWWMLSVLGEPAAVLDGGLEAWGGPLASSEDDNSMPERARFEPRPWPMEALASAEEVEWLRSRSDCVILDARSPERFAGTPNAIDQRFGHIPGAINAPFSDNLGESSKLLPGEELHQRYAALGVGEDTAVVAYCGSGVSACLDLLALKEAGLGPGRLFVGSWSAWAADSSRPAETGP